MPVIVEASLPIRAPIEAVWGHLSDVTTYPSWNPFVVRVDGVATELGSRLTLHVRWPDGAPGTTAGEMITTLSPPVVGQDGVSRATFAYQFTGPLAAPGLVCAVRTQRLEQAPRGAHALCHARGVHRRSGPPSSDPTSPCGDRRDGPRAPGARRGSSPRRSVSAAPHHGA